MEPTLPFVYLHKLTDFILEDKATSFFIGDAAGRQYTKGKGDFSSTDRKWAENVEITFQTPEVCHSP